MIQWHTDQHCEGEIRVGGGEGEEEEGGRRRRGVEGE